MGEYSEPQWDVPGWDWDDNDYSWLDAGVHKDGVSIFFTHGGGIRHQAHPPYGSHDLETFIAMLHKFAEGLEHPRVVWTEDTGGGEAGLWIEGERAPNEDDLERLRHARSIQERNDKQELQWIQRKHPEWFKT